jgi:hypothetical protein
MAELTTIGRYDILGEIGHGDWRSETRRFEFGSRRL